MSDQIKEQFGFLFEDSLIEELIESGQLKNIDEGEILMDIGQKITYIPIIVTGSIKVLSEDEEGNELLLYYLELGDTCAMTLNCCTKETKSAIRAITEMPSQILFVPVEKMEEWMVKYKTWRNFILESYNSRLNEMLEAIDNLAFHNMEERLYKYLKDKVYVNSNPELNITHNEIANDLHSSRVVISRLMKKLELDDKILQHRNRVEVKEFMN